MNESSLAPLMRPARPGIADATRERASALFRRVTDKLTGWMSSIIESPLTGRQAWSAFLLPVLLAAMFCFQDSIPALCIISLISIILIRPLLS